MKDKPRVRPPLKIAVTGAAGFIGRRVVARLAEAGANVVALDRLPQPAGFPAGVEYICGDLKEYSAVGSDSLLVHLAWNMDRADPKAQAASVFDFTRLLGTRGLQGVVGLGSAEEYGDLEGRLSENMAPGLKLSAYGKAKQEACRTLDAWSRGPGRCAIWLRPFIVYGPGQGGNMAIPYALRCATEQKPADFSEGLQSRDFVHVDDVAEGIAQAALRSPELGGAFLVCNLGFGQPVRLREVLERILKKKHAQKWFRFRARPMRAGEPQEQYADTSAAADRLGWRARISWQQGIDALCKESGR
jgi:nucleoside-diphosphate-sugar epimerase